MRPKRPRGRLTPAVAALAVAGCGGVSTAASTNPAPTPSPTGPTARAVAGEGYRIEIPPGWEDRTHDSQAYGRAVRADEGVGLLVLVHPVLGAPLAGVNDVAGDIVVLRSNDPIPDDQLEAFARRAGSIGSVATPTRISLDGAPAYSVTYSQEIQGTPGETTETFVNHGGATYDISLTTSAVAYPSEAQDLASVIHSWHWTA